MFTAKKQAMKCEIFHFQTILWQGEFSKLGKIKASNSLYELKKAINLPFNLMNPACLLSYIRCICDNDILEDLLFCQPFHGRTTGINIF